MRSNIRISMMADSVIDDVKIASFGAILNTETMELSLTNRYIDKDACKVHRDAVREDQAAFEDFAYAIQDSVRKQVTE